MGAPSTFGGRRSPAIPYLPLLPYPVETGGRVGSGGGGFPKILNFVQSHKSLPAAAALGPRQSGQQASGQTA